MQSQPLQNISPMDQQLNQNQQGQAASGQADQMTLLTQMMTTFQSMLSAGAMPQQWSSSTPFQQAEETPEAMPHDIILPKTLEKGIVVQGGL